MSVSKEIETFVGFAEELTRGVVKVHGAARKLATAVNTVIAAELPEAKTNASTLVVCATCGGKRRLGAPGAEIVCPVCQGDDT